MPAMPLRGGNSFSVRTPGGDPGRRDLDFYEERSVTSDFQLGEASGYLLKSAGDAVDAPVLAGRLIASQSGWLLLTVPNDLVRGVFSAMRVLGAELPGPHNNEPLNAHISVMRPEEIEQIGGIDVIVERGREFHYQLGALQEVAPTSWKEMSRVWFLKVKSPDLEKLRKSYGLSARPKNNEYDFHITCAVRKKKILQENSDVAKAASAHGIFQHKCGHETRCRCSHNERHVVDHDCPSCIWAAEKTSSAKPLMELERVLAWTPTSLTS